MLVECDVNDINGRIFTWPDSNDWTTSTSNIVDAVYLFDFDISPMDSAA